MRFDKLWFILIIATVLLLAACKKESGIPIVSSLYVVNGINYYWFPQPDSNYSYPVFNDTIIIYDSAGRLSITSTQFFLDRDTLTYGGWPCNADSNCYGGVERLVNNCIVAVSYNVFFPIPDSIIANISRGGCGLGGQFSNNYLLRGVKH
jgi:hypothetical protein